MPGALGPRGVTVAEPACQKRSQKTSSFVILSSIGNRPRYPPAAIYPASPALFLRQTGPGYAGRMESRSTVNLTQLYLQT